MSRKSGNNAPKEVLTPTPVDELGAQMKSGAQVKESAEVVVAETLAERHFSESERAGIAVATALETTSAEESIEVLVEPAQSELEASPPHEELLGNHGEPAQSESTAEHSELTETAGIAVATALETTSVEESIEVLVEPAQSELEVSPPHEQALGNHGEPAQSESTAELSELNEAVESKSDDALALGQREPLDLVQVKRILEAALLTNPEPLAVSELRRMFPRGETNTEMIRKLLDEIRQEWQGRSVELVQVASGWRFQSNPQLQRYLEKLNPNKVPRYSRAVMETLAIIAYRQPVTRGDIEDIRGVVVSTNIMKALESRGWIDVIGQREVPGRPSIYATTQQFLNDLGLRSLEELPALDDLGSLVEASGNSQVELDLNLQSSAHDSVSDSYENESGEDNQVPSLSAEMPEPELLPNQLH